MEKLEPCVPLAGGNVQCAAAVEGSLAVLQDIKPSYHIIQQSTSGDSPKKLKVGLKQVFLHHVQQQHYSQ